MSPRDLAFVGCRLLALYVLFSFVLSISFNTRFILQSVGMSDWISEDGLVAFAFYAIPLTIGLSMFAILWWGARWIAGRMVADMGASSEPAFESWSRETALSLAVTALGLWILIEHLPGLVAYPLYLILSMDTAISQATYIHRLVAGLVTVGFGLACVLGSRRIAGTVSRLRRL